MDYLHFRGIVPEHSTKPPLKINADRVIDYFIKNPTIRSYFSYDSDEEAQAEGLDPDWFD
jgi:hypothetical protein